MSELPASENQQTTSTSRAEILGNSILDAAIEKALNPEEGSSKLLEGINTKVGRRIIANKCKLYELYLEGINTVDPEEMDSINQQIDATKYGMTLYIKNIKPTESVIAVNLFVELDALATKLGMLKTTEIHTAYNPGGQDELEATLYMYNYLQNKLTEPKEQDEGPDKRQQGQSVQTIA